MADQGHEVCDGRRLFPLLPSPPTPLRRSSLAAAAKRPVAVSVGDVLGPILSKASASIAHRREARHWRASRRWRLYVMLVLSPRRQSDPFHSRGAGNYVGHYHNTPLVKFLLMSVLL